MNFIVHLHQVFYFYH